MRSICVSWLNSSLITSFFDNSQLFESLISSSLSIQSLSIADYCHCYFFLFVSLIIVSLHKQIANLWVRDFGVQWAQHATAMETETVHLCVTDSTSVCTINGRSMEVYTEFQAQSARRKRWFTPKRFWVSFFLFFPLLTIYLAVLLCWLCVETSNLLRFALRAQPVV